MHGVGAAGDVNNDGRDDIVITAPYADTANGPGTGFVRIYSGRDGRPITQLSLLGSATDDAFGIAVASTDTDSDGFPELVVGASGVGSAGQVQVLSAPFSGAAPQTRVLGVGCPTSTGTPGA